MLKIGDDARNVFQAALGPVFVMVDDFNKCEPRDTPWNWRYAKTLAKLAIEAREWLDIQEPKGLHGEEHEYHQMRAVLSSIAALALLTADPGAYIGDSSLEDARDYRVPPAKTENDLIALCSLARDLCEEPAKEVARV
jgi:hypothetical protein